MTRISNIDHLVVLLRQRLLERAKASQSRSAKSGLAAGAPEAVGLQALSALAEVDDRKLRRALIQDILSDHFGSALINDAKFQQVVDRVTTTLEEDPGAARMFERVVADMRALAAKPR